jgi:O-antigen/teichoic acid export membrane protein
MFEFYLVVLFGVCTAIGAGAYAAIGVLAPVDYLPAAVWVAPLAMGLLWSGSLVMLSQGAAVARKTYLTTLAVASGAVVNVTGLSMAAPRYGAFAAVVCFLAGALVAAMLMLFASQRCYHIEYRSSVIASAVLATLGVSATFYFLPPPEPSAASIAVATALRLGIGMSIWAAATYYWLRSEDRRRVIDAMRRPIAGVWGMSKVDAALAGEFPTEAARAAARRRNGKRTAA